MRRYISITQAELVDLIRNCQTVHVTLGPNVRLIWNDEAVELPEAVLRLGLLRGVIWGLSDRLCNENCDGAGI